MKRWATGLVFGVVACGDGASVETQEGAAAPPADDFAAMHALLAWRRAHLRMAVSERYERIEEMEAHTLTAFIQNESEGVACIGGWATETSDRRSSFGRLFSGRDGSVAVIHLGGLLESRSPISLSCRMAWSDVPAMTGLTSEELSRIFAPYPARAPEDAIVSFFYRWTPEASWAGVTVNGRLTMLED